MNHCYRRVLVALFPLTVSLAAMIEAPAWASPPEQTWTESLFLHPPGPAELGMGYDLVLPEDGVFDGGIDVVTLRTSAGLDRAPLDVSPSIGLVKAGPISDIHHVGLRARFRLLGSTSKPVLGVAVGYKLMLFGDHGHRVEQRLSGRVLAGQSLAFSWEAGAEEQFGDDTHVEGRVSAAVSYGMAMNMVRLSFESFALLPLTGQRLTDFGVGDDREAPALYLGPGLRMDLENYLWVSGSVVTGALAGGGAPMLVRVMVGTQF